MTSSVVPLTISETYRRRFPNLGFGIGTIQDCVFFEKREDFKLHKRELLRKLKRRVTLAQIEERIHLYDEFFQEWGYPCPFPGYLKRTVEMGFPIVNHYIDAHIVAEMCQGILMAIQDLGRFRGGVDARPSERRGDFRGGVREDRYLQGR